MVALKARLFEVRHASNGIPFRTVIFILGALNSLWFSAPQGLASPLVSPRDLKRIEAQFTAALKKEKPDPDRLYWIHVLAARELNAHGFKSKAREYFQRAMALPTKESKSEPAIELFHDSLQRGDSNQAKLDLEVALKNTSDEETRTYLKGLADGVLEGKLQGNPLATGLYGQPMVWKHLGLLMSQRRYSEALAMLDRDALEHGNIQEKITYDLLSVLVNQKRAGPLLCEPVLKKYPDAYSYSMKTCSLLLEFKTTGKKDPEKLKDVQNFFEREQVKNTEILAALKELP